MVVDFQKSNLIKEPTGSPSSDKENDARSSSPGVKYSVNIAGTTVSSVLPQALS